MPRHQRVLSATGTYHIMMRGNERKDLFLDEDDKQRFLETLFAKKTETGFLLYAYCLMDNHVHLVLREQREDLATTMKRINASYAYYFNQRNKRIGHLFQDRFKSEPIEDERYLLAAVRYIHNNPVKAGIVAEPDHYKWSSFNSYIAPSRPESKNIDTELILSIMSNNQMKAIEEFQRFSQESDDRMFLDIVEEPIWTMEQGQVVLDDYLQTAWPGVSIEEIITDAGKRNEVIAYLRGNTGLSVRKIADLLGIKRGSVQNVKATIGSK